ncbi:MATE family efflux transporter [Labrys monachus]|uniref:MATE family multidrug resistance protein n=1 Tax=Labrys monachus TaxID=217067 RepID=A0ABU0FDC6_9HYPH|nr:MATE family efflux transporter [Labrys monachus]MDQ0392584.1 MATE family multidrug resistance protein [Labrys monachus]
MNYSPAVAVRPVAVSHRIVLGIAAPMTLAHLSTPLLGLADTTVIGQIGDASLIGAVALSAVLFDFLFWGFGFLRMGTAGLTAQALGAGDGLEQRAVFLRALVMAAVLGLVIVGLQGAIAAVAFPLLGGSPAVMSAARLYFHIRIWSAPFTFANYAVLGWLIGMGRTTTGLFLQIGINIANILLCIVLALGLGWGVTGTAVATSASEICGAAVGLVVVAAHFGGRFGIPAAVVFDRPKFVRMIAINRDIMLRTLLLLAAWLFFARQGAQAGDVTLAANAILNNFFLLGGYFLDGVSTAAEQLCGRSIGANNRPAFEASVRYSLLWSLFLAVTMSALLFLAGGTFIDFMTKSTPVREEARHFLAYAAMTPIAGALAFTFDGIYIGATWNAAMRNLMIVALACYFMLWWLLQPFGNHGLWLALIGFLVARGAGQGLAYGRLLPRAFP